MRVLVQKVKQAEVRVADQQRAYIDKGLLLFVGINREDAMTDANKLVKKVVNLRIFPEEADQGWGDAVIVNPNLALLAVSQFTLYASLKKGNRPSFSHAAPAQEAETVFNYFVAQLAQTIARPVQTGVFGADMAVSLINDGPFTLWLDSRENEC